MLAARAETDKFCVIDFRRQKVVCGHHQRGVRLQTLPRLELHRSVERVVDVVGTDTPVLVVRCRKLDSVQTGGLHELCVLV